MVHADLCTQQLKVLSCYKYTARLMVIFLVIGVPIALLNKKQDA